MKIGILGTGSLGTALAAHFYKLGYDVLWWGRDPELVEHINAHHRNPKHMSEFLLPYDLKATNDMSLIANAPHIISAVPTPYLRNVWGKLKEHIENPIIINTSKGIEVDTGMFAHEIFREIFPLGTFLALSGPSFAREILKGFPTAVVLVGPEKHTCQLIKDWSTPALRIYSAEDLVGVELAGAYKNVLAIASGAVAGLGLGENTRAALITRGVAELTRLGIALGAQMKTFMGLAGVGDIILTCSSKESRNYSLGWNIGRGLSVDDALSRLKGYPEGYKTSLAMKKLSHELSVETPIVDAVASVLHEGKPIRRVLADLLSRPPKKEFWGIEEN